MKNKNIPILITSLFSISTFIGFIVELVICNGSFNVWSSMCLALSLISFLAIFILIAYFKVTKYDHKVDQIKVCKYCNTANDLDARYCKYCGQKFDDEINKNNNNSL